MNGFWRGFDKLLNGLAIFAALIIPFMFVSIVYDVTTRTLRMFQINWVVAITEYALLYATALAAPWLLREKGHVSMEALRTLMPARVTGPIEKAVVVLCAVACAIVTAFAIPITIQNIGVGDMRANFLDRWLLFVPVVICFALCTVQFIRMLVTRESLYKGVSADQEGL
ncbi:tripartite ATP-independent periplasmic transporter DctQ component [Dinoroseobacter shibae DFL 12 = DSM 16493]|jgi:TRAP-type C4-dicarboxylate transport system permease small subunit|uniref:TRAP transporter small permease protein n=1 Tax=Dinoroseobacter shibae (strain DSM 16493 / NCIMB 14021 / DFL 12) TaxID=398580 RepID=A8LSH0_DINSH|nr:MULTISPECIES: TRAP transporter small permease subunit [Dinoroseobacter]ABV92784.1 tripartite ATP-independent periplasmic transporter DctQ component [Dinoroseobacter shibae DFL 12 = DSM 16493]MDD9715884.1 TRAP transporter small permease subunit [Dinoroseobacter sp. PD6]URF47726.1 TRAP transporter small permease [Dinoroseobacter shibae]URF52036.1 TRAP transporter small permease [Dinoroseobacter shibae]